MLSIIFFSILILLLSLMMVYCFSELALAINYLRFNKKKHVETLQNLMTFPFVTIQLPIYNEKYVIDRLIQSAVDVDYPKDRFEIQVLDDSTDETVEIVADLVKNYAEEGFNIEHIHRSDRHGFKAGALKEGMKKAKGAYIAIFDADFIVPKAFLKETLPHFNDDNIGMVQTRWVHLNDQYSMLTKIQAFFIDLHFTIQQKGRNGAGYFMNFNGTAGIWRKICIDDAGGWTSDTLTEDLDLSYRAQLKGWKFKYYEQLHSPSELPAIMSGIRSQQFRWIKGGAEVAKKLIKDLLVNSSANFKQKWFGSVHLLATTTYLINFLIIILSVPLVYIVSDEQKGEVISYLSIYMLSTLSIAFAGLVAFLNTQKDLNYKLVEFGWRFFMFVCFSFGLTFQNTLAVVEGFIGKKSPFIRTPKYNLTNSSRSTWTNVSYLKQTLTPQLIIEIFLMFYFLFGILLGVYCKFYSLIALHLMVAIGFFTIIFYTIKHARLS